MNNFCVRNYHIENFMPNENTILETKDIVNLVCVKPKLTFNTEGMFFFKI